MINSSQVGRELSAQPLRPLHLRGKRIRTSSNRRDTAQQSRNHAWIQSVPPRGSGWVLEDFNRHVKPHYYYAQLVGD
jgi:hypothetical protein